MFIVAIAIMSAIVMWLWNLLIPDLFHGPEVNYWQALGLLVLTRLLVGIRGRRGHWWAPWARRHHHKRHHRTRWDDWCGYGDWYGGRRRDTSGGPERSQEEWQAVKNRWKAEFGSRMHDWWKEWEAMSPEERRAYKADQRRRHREWKAEYRRGRHDWRQEDSDRGDAIESGPEDTGV